jgi:SEC-C motif
MTSLTPQQHRIIAAISNGTTITQAAAAENIHRNTIGNWRRTNPTFAQELEFAATEYRCYWHEQVTALIPQAIHAIEDCLTNPKSSPSIRFRAASLIVKMAAQTELGSFIPTVQTTSEPAATSGLGLRPGHLASFIPTVQPAQECTTPEELASFIPTSETTDSKEIPDQASEPFTLREAAKAWAAAQSAQKSQPIRVAPQPGRNEACPCNSGQKFKRCCLNKAA